MSIIQYDNELENAIFFCDYITVMNDGVMTGGGNIKAYDEKKVQIGDEWYSREKSTFIVSLPPQAYINF
ncbi:hypothetical protein HZF08_16110 [Paenibacillus sp. CGMCC 1.16610]|uniref:Uncharacterized protein n=1 Tax=Paenibacillus anseongense TaxID=2682845 RepID=A0ABW9UH39_9BACL|nr:MULTISPECIES: hypothetical protein [Paenibacillus]MBA2939839.1 hypothetical protein [Paenibacillus sp. CGMCC 1.16610]MVQ39499.1 hypothetical protein [Paenibacillus anseongense]